MVLRPTEAEIMTSVNAMRSFARVNGIREDVAVEIYEYELSQLGAEAKIARFITVIAEKHVKEALRSRSGFRFMAARKAA